MIEYLRFKCLSAECALRMATKPMNTSCGKPRRLKCLSAECDLRMIMALVVALPLIALVLNAFRLDVPLEFTEEAKKLCPIYVQS